MADDVMLSGMDQWKSSAYAVIKLKFMAVDEINDPVHGN
jgi:hypothetical protein